jgi:RNA binding exosome subunit
MNSIKIDDIEDLIISKTRIDKNNKIKNRIDENGKWYLQLDTRMG